MKLLVICPHYAPDVAPTGEVMTSIATELMARGHELHVVTALPWYEHHRVEPGWGGRLSRRERTPWGQVTRVQPFPTDKRNIPARALAFAGFTLLAALKAAFGRRARRGWRPDAVLAMSPPLTLGVAGWLAARRWRVPYVFNIQDVFPDVAVELGAITNPTVIRVASWLERWCYRRADAVTVLSDDLRDNVRAKLPHNRGDGVRVIPNFVDTERIAPRDPEAGSYRDEHELQGKQVVMYAGNVGLSQSLDLLLAAARAFAHETGVAFVINGQGAARADLEWRARHLDNVLFVDLQPEETLPDLLAAADVHVVPLKRGLARASVPSKTYSILAAGRPLVASVDPGSEIARLVARAGAGIAVPPEDPEAFTEALRHLVRSPEEAAAMGRAGRAFVERWASPVAVAQAYERLFEELGSR
jgi:colanic acid biosynthesis glycosyl transferase WcaI